MTELRSFLGLFDRSSVAALRRMFVLSSLLAVADFAVVLLLYPVLGSVLSTGNGESPALGPSFIAEVDPDRLLLLAVALLVARALGELALKAWWTRRAGAAEVALSSRMLAAYAWAPYAFHLRRNSSDLLAKAIAQVNLASTSGLNGLASIGADVASMVMIVLALFVASATAAAVVLVCVGALTAAFVALNRSIVRQHTDRYTANVGQTYARATTVLQGIRELTVADARGPALESITGARREMVDAQQRLLLLGDIPRITLEIVLYLGLFAALALTATNDARTAVPTMALFLFAAVRILPAVGRTFRNLTATRAGVELGKTLGDELAELAVSTDGASSGEGEFPSHGSLTLTDVCFTYESGDHPVLAGVDLTVEHGTSVGVVGPSGAGKSTLLGLVLGLLTPDSGTVAYGGRPIGTANPAWFRHVAYVPQVVFVLDQSVASNVALGDDEPDLARVADALERAHLSDVVAALPDGVDTTLGEGGSRLSVGQRQRLGIARALYRRASLMLLDEPTAALDGHSEARVVETIQGLRGLVTTIVISHRMTPLTGVGRLVRLEQQGLTDVVVDDRRPEVRS